MPVHRNLRKSVRDTVAKNIVTSGDYILINFAADPMVVIDSGADNEQWAGAIETILKGLPQADRMNIPVNELDSPSAGT